MKNTKKLSTLFILLMILVLANSIFAVSETNTAALQTDDNPVAGGTIVLKLSLSVPVRELLGVMEYSSNVSFVSIAPINSESEASNDGNNITFTSQTAFRNTVHLRFSVKNTAKSGDKITIRVLNISVSDDAIIEKYDIADAVYTGTVGANALSDNNKLRSLQVTAYADKARRDADSDGSEVTLSPSFSAENTAYGGDVSNELSFFSVNAQAAHSTAKISGDLNGELEVGNNKITVVVTAEDGTERSYNITINRNAQSVASGEQSSVDGSTSQESTVGGSEAQSEPTESTVSNVSLGQASEVSLVTPSLPPRQVSTATNSTEGLPWDTIITVILAAGGLLLIILLVRILLIINKKKKQARGK